MKRASWSHNGPWSRCYIGTTWLFDMVNDAYAVLRLIQIFHVLNVVMMSTSSTKLPSPHHNIMTVSAQRCVLSRSVKAKRDAYDLVFRLCHLQSQFHGPDTFLGNSSRRWIALFSFMGRLIICRVPRRFIS